MKRQLVIGVFLALLLAGGAALFLSSRSATAGHLTWQDVCSGGPPYHSCNPVSTWTMVDGQRVYLCPTPAPKDTCYRDD
jgi:hypothetical protein